LPLGALSLCRVPWRSIYWFQNYHGRHYSTRSLFSMWNKIN
jgi:hypothetical protein